MLLLRRKQNIAEKAKKLQKVAQKSCNVPQKLRPMHIFLHPLQEKTPHASFLARAFDFCLCKKILAENLV